MKLNECSSAQEMSANVAVGIPRSAKGLVRERVHELAAGPRATSPAAVRSAATSTVPGANVRTVVG